MKWIGAFIAAFLCLLLAACSGNKSQQQDDSVLVTVESNSDLADTASAQPESIDSLPTVIDFYAVWCGPCKQIAPVFDNLKEQYAGRVNFVSIDVDKNEYDARRFGVEVIPTFVFLDNEGNEVTRIVGADASALKNATQSLAQGQNSIEVL